MVSHSENTGKWGSLKAYGVAVDLNAPSDLLLKLAYDSDKEVRWRVAENPSSPPEALLALLDSSDEGVRRGVAENPSTPLEIL